MKTAKVKVTNQQFFLACEEVRNQRETILKDHHKLQDVADFLAPRLGFPIGIRTVANVLDSVNVQLVRPMIDTRRKTLNTTKITIGAIMELFRRLGEEPPADLIALNRRATGQAARDHAANGKPEAPPIPVKAVIDPKLIRVANQGGR